MQAAKALNLLRQVREAMIQPEADECVDSDEDEACGGRGKALSALPQ